MARESSGRIAHVRIAEHVGVETDVDLAPVYGNVEHVRNRLAIRNPVPHAQDRNHEDLDAGRPRRGDDRQRLLDALDEYDRDVCIVYQAALDRVDIENVAGSAELLTCSLVLEARVVEVRIVGPEYVEPLPVRAMANEQHPATPLPLPLREAARELATVGYGPGAAFLVDLARYRGAYFEC